MKKEIIQLIVVIIGATGFWRLVEYLLKFNSERKLKQAEARNLDIKANDLVLENWMQWSEKMEERISQLEEKNIKLYANISDLKAKNAKMHSTITELEAKNTKMHLTIAQQKERINELQRYVDQLEAEIIKYKNR